MYKKLLFHGILLLGLLAAKTSLACGTQVTDPIEIIKNYPVVVKGRFTQDGKFQIEDIYKGFRKRPIEFIDEEITQKKPVIDKPALILADFQKSKASLKKCGEILYEGDQLNGVSYASLLAESVVYKIAANSRVSEAEKLGDNWQKYGDISEYLRQNADYLLLLELSLDTVERSLKVMRTPLDHWARQGSPHELWERCASEAPLEGGYLTKETTVLMENAVKWQYLRSSSITFYGLRDLSEMLLRISEPQSAFYSACVGEAWDLYLSAALAWKRNDLINGAKLIRVSNLSDSDLSGLDLREVRLEGKLENVKVTNTDFTAAILSAVQFKNVNLSDAKLALATYDCKTIFPDKFNPLAHHMLAQWDSEECPADKQPKIDLANVTITPHHSKADEFRSGYNLMRVKLRKVDAHSSKLDRIICSYCEISDSNFTGTQLRLYMETCGALGSSPCRITNTSFKNADLRGSYFAGSEFRNVDFTGANLSDVYFQQAKYDAATKFPKEFDPDKFEMQKLED
jgi:uncharacterized protein YjbI with pentapeptide repeats